MNELTKQLATAGSKRPVTEKDLSQVEARLGITLPDDMKAFYLQINGTDVLGIETSCRFHSPLTGSDYEISHFLPFKYGGKAFTVDGSTSIARVEENRAPNLLVFAIAEDHSRFVVDTNDGAIYNYQHIEVKWYFTPEGRPIFFDVSTYAEHADRPSSGPFRSEYKYYLGNKTLVAHSFSEFLDHLSVEVSEPDKPEETPPSRHTDFWGNVTYRQFMGFQAERKVEVPELNLSATVYVGKAYDSEGNEVTTPPTLKKLDEYEQTLKQFLDNVPSIVSQIAEKAYKYYQKNYAAYYEKPFEVLFPNEMVMPQADSRLHAPLGITNAEAHLAYLTYRPCERIRALGRKTILLPFDYALDEEHGLEVKIVDGKVKSIARAGEFE